MSLALLPLLNVELIDRIYDYIPADADDIEWETLYGWITIYQTKHYITYGGGPEGGYVYWLWSVSQGGIGGVETGCRSLDMS